MRNMTENREKTNITRIGVTQGAPVGLVDIKAFTDVPSSEAKIGSAAASYMSVVRPDGVGIVKNVLRSHPHSDRSARYFGVLPDSKELHDPEGTYIRIQNPEYIEVPTSELVTFPGAQTAHAITKGQTGMSKVSRVVVEIISNRSVEGLGLGDIFKNEQKAQESQNGQKDSLSQFPIQSHTGEEDLVA